MGMRNHTYQLEVERTSGGDLKINSAQQLVKANQHTSRYEKVNKKAFSATLNASSPLRTVTASTGRKRSKSRA
jgi:hypothetical protein